MKETCKACRFFLASEEKGRGNCLYDPPRVQFMPVEFPADARGAIASGNKTVVRIMPFSGLPYVREVDFCNHFTTNGEGTKH